MCYESLKALEGKETLDDDEATRKRHSPEQIVRKLRDARRDAERREGPGGRVAGAWRSARRRYHRWRTQYGGMKAEEAKRLKKLEDENKRLKEVVAELTLDNQMLKHVAEGNW